MAGGDVRVQFLNMIAIPSVKGRGKRLNEIHYLDEGTTLGRARAGNLDRLSVRAVDGAIAVAGA